MASALERRLAEKTGGKAAPETKKTKPAPAPKGGGGSALERRLAEKTGKAAPAKAAPDHPARVDNSPLGLLGQVRDVVTGLPRGIASLATEVVRAPFMPSPILHPKENEKYVAEKLPLLSATYESVPKTVKTLNPQDLVDVARGNPENTALAKRVREEGVLGTALATVSDLSLLAGGAGAIGKAAGAGRLTEVTKLTGLADAAAKAAGTSKGLKAAEYAAQAEKAAAAGHAARAGELAHAAEMAGRAEALLAKGTASAAERTVSALDKTAKMGAQIAGGPAKPYELAAKGLGKVAGPAVRSAIDHIAKTESGERFLNNRAGRKAIKGLNRAAGAEVQAETYRVYKAFEDAGNLVKDADERVATTLIRTGDAANLAKVARLDDATLKGALDATFGKGAPSVAAFRLAADFVEGRLPEEQAARLSEAIDIIRERVTAPAEERYLSGPGTRGHLGEAGLAERAAQTANDPLPIALEREVARRTARPQRSIDYQTNKIAEAQQAALSERPGTPSAAQERRIGARDERVRRAEASLAELKAKGAPERQVAAAQRRLVKATNEAASAKARAGEVAQSRTRARLEREIANRAEKIDRARESIAIAEREARDAIHVQAAKNRPALYHGEGMIRHLKGLADEAEKAAPGSGALFAEAIADIGTTMDRLIAKGIDPEYVPGGVTDGLAPKLSAGADDKLRSVRRLPYERQRQTGGVALTWGEQAKKYAERSRDELRNQVAGQLQELHGKKLSDLGLAEELRGLKGEELHAALGERGLVAWNPKTGQLVKAEQVAVTDAVLPKEFADAFDRYYAPPGALERGAQNFIDPVIRKWKSATLALSPRWQAGNIMGNVVLSTVGAGLNPAELVHYVAQARKMVKAGNMPDSLASREFIFADVDAVAHLLDQPKTPLGKLINKSYAFNSYVDNVNRTAIYLAKKAKGFSDQSAVEAALRAAGDFWTMTKFERQVAKRVMPFYAWQRHITKLTLRLPVENPARVAWTLHLSKLAEEVSEDPGMANEFNEGTVPVGDDKRLNLRNLGPFGSSILVDPSVRGALYNVSPVAKAGIAALTGRSVNREFEPVDRPGANAYQDGSTGLFALRDPVEFAKLVAQQIPQTRQLQDIVAGDVPVRHETGEPKRERSGKGPVKLTGRELEHTIARLLGIPIPEPEQKAPRKTR